MKKNKETSISMFLKEKIPYLKESRTNGSKIAKSDSFCGFCFS